MMDSNYVSMYLLSIIFQCHALPFALGGALGYYLKKKVCEVLQAHKNAVILQYQHIHTYFTSFYTNMQL